MKKRLLFSLLMLTWFGMAKASIVTVGDGTDNLMSDALPTSARYEYSLTQQIYTGEEIGVSGTINSIAFYKANEGSVTRTLDIYMAQTDMAVFTGSTDWIPVSESDKVFSGSVTFDAGGWTTIPLTVPYEYWDKENLVITIDDNSNDYSSNKVYFRTMEATNASILTHGEFTDYQPITDLGTYSGTVVAQKAQIQFDFTPVGKNVVKIGGGLGSSDYLPAYRGNKYLLSQQIYTKDELGKGGSIKGVTFKTSNESFSTNGGTNNVDIYLVHTSQNQFSGTSTWVEYTEDDKVFSGYISHYYPNNFMKVTFDTPFEYDGQRNVAFVVVQHNGAEVSGPYAKCLSFTAPKQALVSYNSSSAYDPYHLASYEGTVLNEKNQVWFDVAPSSAIGIGGTALGSAPINTASKYGFSEMVYTSDEIGQTGVINSLSFYCTNEAMNPDERVRNIDIYLTTSYGSGFGSSYSASWKQVYESDKVFSGNVTLEAGKWIKIVLDKPYRYSTSGNGSSLVVAIDDNTGIAVTSYSDGASQTNFLSNTTSDNAVVRVSGDDDIDPITLTNNVWTNTSNLSKTRPQIVINFQETWQIGEGTETTDLVPFPGVDDRTVAITQQIYTADEIGKEQADITSLGFFYDGIYAYAVRTVDIYLTSPTYPSTFEGENSWIPVTTDDMVFSGKVTLRTGDWMDIPLSRPFHYSRGGGGIHNLVVTIVDKTGGSDSKFLSYEAEGQAICAYRFYGYNDPAQYMFNPEDMSGVSGTVLNQKNQIQFNNVPAVVKPINLRAEDVNLTSAHIKWNAVTTDIDGLQLQYKPADETTWNYLEGNLNPNQTSWTLYDLKPAKTYDVRLCVVNGSEYGEWAEIQFSTDLKPTHITESVTYNSATITWEGPGEMWDFQYRRYGESSWKGVTGLTEKTYSLTGLEEGTSYDVRVRVTDGNDHFGSWVTSDFDTPERYPQPNDVYAESVGAYIAKLGWDEMGTATAWQICFDEDEENLIDINTSNSSFDGGRVTYLLTGLEPGKTYIVKIRSVYPEEEGYSEWVDISFTTTALNPVPNDIVVDAKKNSATISWKGESDSYKLSYRKAAALFVENFENGLGGWTTVNLGSSSGIRYNNYFYFSYYGAPGLQYLISPTLYDIPAGATLAFRHHSGGVQTYFKVGYSTTTNDVGAFTWTDDTYGSNDWDWYPYTQTLPAGVKYIAIQNISDDINNQYASLYIDDITIAVDGAEPGEWTTVETTEKQVTLTDLEANTPYEYQITGLMEGQPDATTSIKTFMTNSLEDLPEISVNPTPTTAQFSWTGNYDMYKLEYRTAEKEDTWQDEEIFLDETFEGGMDWITYNTYINSSIVSNVGLNDGGGFMFETGGFYPEQYIMRGITDYIPEGTLLRFYYKGGYDYMGNGLAVGYSMTDYDVTSFMWIPIMDDEDVSGWQEYSIELPEGAKYIGFCWSGISGDMFLDDVRVAKYTYTNYVIPAGEWQELYTTENEALITDLEWGTTYDYQLTCIRMGGSSDFVGIKQFTTPWSAIDIALDAKGANAATITANDGVYANVTIQNRTLKKDGQWQTLCLPFDVNVEGSVLEGADVRLFKDTKIDKNQSFAVFDFLTPVTTLKAGYPYLIKWESGADIEDPVFEGVTIRGEANPLAYGSNVIFTPCYDDFAFDEWTYMDYVVDGSPVLKKAEDGYEVNAFECYFVIESDYRYYADTFVLNTGTEDDLITGISSLKAETGNEAIYNLAGQRLGKKQRGINIVGGKKVLVK